MSLQTEEFDVADYLYDEQSISIFLTEVLKSDNPKEIAAALHAVVRARGGVERLAKESGMAAKDLRDALERDESPDASTLFRVLHGLGVTLSASLAA